MAIRYTVPVPGVDKPVTRTSASHTPTSRYTHLSVRWYDLDKPQAISVTFHSRRDLAVAACGGSYGRPPARSLVVEITDAMAVHHVPTKTRAKTQLVHAGQVVPATAPWTGTVRAGKTICGHTTVRRITAYPETFQFHMERGGSSHGSVSPLTVNCPDCLKDQAAWRNWDAMKPLMDAAKAMAESWAARKTRLATIQRLAAQPPLALVSQADQDTLEISRHDGETIREALDRANPFPTPSLEERAKTRAMARRVFYWDNAGLFGGWPFMDLAPGQEVPFPPRSWLWSQVRVVDQASNGPGKAPWEPDPRDVWLDPQLVNRKPGWWGGRGVLDPG